jgi:prevent-host-death family protein
MIVQAARPQYLNREQQQETTVAISLTEDIKTVEDLVNDPRGLLEQAQRNGRPVVIAEAGKPAVVLLKAERYEWLMHLVTLSRMLNEAEESIRQGKTIPAEEVFKELLGDKKRRAKKVSR